MEKQRNTQIEAERETKKKREDGRENGRERNRETETERGVNKVNYIWSFLSALFHS